MDATLFQLLRLLFEYSQTIDRLTAERDQLLRQQRQQENVNHGSEHRLAVGDAA